MEQSPDILVSEKKQGVGLFSVGQHLCQKSEKAYLEICLYSRRVSLKKIQETE